MKLKSVVALILAASAVAAEAVPQWCAGKVPSVLVEADGTLMILTTWRNDWTALCNISTERLGITAAVCRSWQAILLSAHAQEKNVVVMYGEAPSCASLPTYQAAPRPAYVRIEETR